MVGQVAKRQKWGDVVETGRYVELVLAKVPVAALLPFAQSNAKGTYAVCCE